MTTLPAQPTASHPKNRPPTPAQRKYLRDLAMKCGETFAVPTTSVEASREIDRLKGRKPTTASDQRRERRQISNDMATRRGDDAQVRDHELTGYGSSATWNRDTPTSRETPTTPKDKPAPSGPAKSATNPPVVLGRYRTRADEERTLFGQRVLGRVRVTDVPSIEPPAGGDTRRYVVESGLTSHAELNALLADYQGIAARTGTIPILGTYL